ncbi:MAG: hypothetical protein JNK82_39980 [Myxococcaceae bacterium]|nr:hypothetical protein [Myxococcaceae bacterium]
MLLAVGPAVDTTVTVPLEHYLQLTEKKAAATAAPPVAAVVTDQRLSARATAGGTDVEAHFAVDVLASTWSTLCVLKLEPGTQLAELPHVDHATLAPLNGQLCFLSQTPGNYTFDVKLMVRGTRMTAGRDALWSTASFEGEAVPQAEGGWSFVPKKKVVVAEERPPMEPSCPKAVAQLVSTVEGHAQLNVTYYLKLDREQPLSFTAPAGWKVERVFVNGVARKGGLDVVASPSHDTNGTVELQLSRELGVFHLSGRLDLELPKASWPVAQVEAAVNLPAVFEYRRLGGSLEPAEASAGAGIPGKRLGFRQHLVAASAPTVELEYSVELTGRYFTTRREVNGP